MLEAVLAAGPQGITSLALAGELGFNSRAGHRLLVATAKRYGLQVCTLWGGGGGLCATSHDAITAHSH